MFPFPLYIRPIGFTFYAPYFPHPNFTPAPFCLSLLLFPPICQSLVLPHLDPSTSCQFLPYPFPSTPSFHQLSHFCSINLKNCHMSGIKEINSRRWLWLMFQMSTSVFTKEYGAAGISAKENVLEIIGGIKSNKG